MKTIGNNPDKTRQTQVVASGALTNGTPVIVNSDGTVSVVVETSATQSIGTRTTFNSDTTYENVALFDSNSNKVVLIYYDGANSGGVAIVGTVSGTSISFGTETSIYTSGSRFFSATFDSNSNKVVVFYKDEGNSNYGTAKVGTVSGTSISFGSAVVFESATSDGFSATFDSNSNKVVVAYRNRSNGQQVARVGTVSGTSISFGGSTQWQPSGFSSFIKTTFDSNSNKVVIAYQDVGNSSYGTAVVGTVSGTSISFGSPVVFESADSPNIGITFDNNAGKVVVAYRDGGNSNYGTAIVGTVSGTSISFGTPVVFHAVQVGGCAPVFNSIAEKVVISYIDQTAGSYVKFVSGTVSGASISFGSPVTLDSNTGANEEMISSTFDSNAGKIVTIYSNSSFSNRGESIVFQIAYTSTNLTSENYIGTAKSGAADGDGVVVNTQGTVIDIPVINYILSGASYDSKSFSTASQDVTMKAMAFNTDGTKMYLVGTTGDAIYQYSLSTAFDVSTASYDSVSFSVSSQSVFPSALEFNNNGTKMYVGSSNTNGVFQYSLSSAFDLSTASYDSVSFDPSTQETSVQGIQFNNDGTKLYIIGTQSDAVFQYSLSSAFDLSTTSYDSVSFSVASQSVNSHGLEFNNDGTKLFVCDVETDTIYQYNLTTGFDLSTASYSSVSLDVSSQDAYPAGMAFNSDGSKMYIVGDDSNYIYQYSTAGNSLTAGQSYYVQTDGTLSTTAGDPSVFAGTAVSATKLIVKG